MEKHVSIVVAGSDVIKDMSISPGSTVQQVLENAELQGYKLSRKGGEPLAPDTDLFQESTNFEKLYASPEDVSVGAGGSTPLPLFGNNNNIRIVGIRHLSELSQPITFYQDKKKTKLLKTGKAYPYWKESGWKKTGRFYRGYYKTNYGKWEGIVKENFFNNYSFFIFYLPAKVKDSSHGVCFTHKGDGVYSIHFSKWPRNISEGIIAIEMLVAEAIK